MNHKVRESKIQSTILKDLESYSPYITLFKVMKANKSHVPDVFFTSALTGACMLEIKKEGEVPDSGQLEFMKCLSETGTKSFWCDSVIGWMKIKRDLGIKEENLRNAHVSFNHKMK